MRCQSETVESHGLVLDPRIEESREAMIRYAQSRLGERFSRSDAEDAVQAAFLEAWRDLPTLRDQNAFWHGFGVSRSSSATDYAAPDG